MEAATLALDGPGSVGRTQAYLQTGADRAPLIQRLALVACRVGNDPHNQEIAQCLLDDYGRNRAAGRDWLLLGAAQHTARHRKYGDFLECSRRFGQALNIDQLH
jgi:hypothetical protein